MIVYRVIDLFGVRRRVIKERRSDKNKRRYMRGKKYRRWWFWHADRWDQRHGEEND